MKVSPRGSIQRELFYMKTITKINMKQFMCVPCQSIWRKRCVCYTKISLASYGRISIDGEDASPMDHSEDYAILKCSQNTHSRGLVIEGLRVRIPVGVAGEFSSPELTFFADSYCYHSCT